MMICLARKKATCMIQSGQSSFWHRAATARIEVNMTASSGRYLMDAEMAQMIAAYLEAVGIKVNLELVDATVLSNMFSGKENKDLFMIGLSDGQYDGCYPLAQFCDPIRTEGQSDYDNPEIVELYQQARVEREPEKRAELSRQIQHPRIGPSTALLR